MQSAAEEVQQVLLDVFGHSDGESEAETERVGS